MIAAPAHGWRLRFPIWLQVFFLLLVSLTLVQALTIFVFLRLPAPTPRLTPISAIAKSLQDGTSQGMGDAEFQTQTHAPTYGSKSRRPDKIARAELASLLHVAPTRLAFHHLSEQALLFFEPVRRQERGPPPGPPHFGEPEFRFGPPMDFQPGQPQGPGRRPWGAPSSQFVFGDFSVALQTENGEWRVLRSKKGPFPDAVQTRFLLWAAFAFVVAAPAGYLFSRSITAPVLRFARACDKIGQDPNSPPLNTSDGPAEIAVAANAFRAMHIRLQKIFLHQQATLSAISHDLRGPLSKLKFRADEWPSPYRDDVMDSIVRMERVLSVVIDSTRHEFGYRRIERLDVCEVLKQVCAEFNSAATVHAVGPLFLDGDAAALERMFFNLIDNGVKYGGCVDIYLDNSDTDATISIQDNGPGLPEMALETVFRPFHRLAETARLNPDGLGVGLMVSRSVARAHGGDVRLTTYERGLKATVFLPLAQT